MELSWKFWLSIALSCLVVGFLFGCNIGSDRAAAACEKDKTELRDQLSAQCITLQQKTTEIDRGLQNDLTDIADRLNAGVVFTPACVPIHATGDTGNTHAAGRTKPVRAAGLSVEWLRRKIAAVGDEYRVKVAAFQKACGQ